MKMKFEDYDRLRDEENRMSCSIRTLGRMIENARNGNAEQVLGQTPLWVAKRQLKAMKKYHECLLYRLGLAEILGHEEAPATDWSSMDDEEIKCALDVQWQKFQTALEDCASEAQEELRREYSELMETEEGDEE